MVCSCGKAETWVKIQGSIDFEWQTSGPMSPKQLRKFKRKFTWNHLADAIPSIGYHHPMRYLGLQLLDFDKLLKATSLANKTEQKYQTDVVSSFTHDIIADKKHKTKDR